jgi:hypothetical protein
MAMAKIRQKRQAPEDLEKAKAEATEARLMLERLVA